MMKLGIKYVLFLALLVGTTLLKAQEKRSLTPADMPSWKRLSSANISNNGTWISYEVNPNVGDGILHLKNPDNGIDTTFERGMKAQLSPQNNYIVFWIKPQLDSLRKLKLDEVSKSKWPSDTLAIYVFEKDTLMKFAAVKSFKMSIEASDWLTFQYKKPQKDKPKPLGKKIKKKKNKKSKKEKVPESTKKPIKRKTSDLVIFNPVSLEKQQIKNVSQYNISKFGNSIAYIQPYGDTADSVGVFWYENIKQITDTVYKGQGVAKRLTFNESGEELVWIISADTGKAKAYSLYSTRGNHGTRIIIDTNDRNLPEGHTVSENGRIYFSRDGNKIFFGTADKPIELPKDSIPTDEKSTLDVWSWTDLKIQPMQLARKAKEEKKTFLAVFHINSQKMVSLQNDSAQFVRPLQKGDNQYALWAGSKKYELSNSWEFPFPRDYYRMDLFSGEKTLIAERVGYNTSISPSGKYFVYFDGENGEWISVEIESGVAVKISGFLVDQGQVLVNEEAEIPAKPFAFGTSGWTTNEEWVLIKTKFDIWKVDPAGVKQPEPLTMGYADQNQIQIKFKNFDYDLDFVNLDSAMILSGQSRLDNSSGLLLRTPGEDALTVLSWGEQYISGLTRAKQVNRFFYRPMSFELYADIMYTQNTGSEAISIQFDNCQKISNALPEQSEFYWGSVKKYYWKDKNGDDQKGLIYYPESFDSTQQYPVILYFYEKQFTTEYRRKSFRPSHSTIAVPLYTSNGYIVMMPDIHYGKGHPGNDGLHTVTSAAESLKKLSFVDGSKIGIQGQSWGGYQVAYMVTQTNMFAAAMAGAPVSNMTSAYGGIRWASGMSRAFQYEKTQSRIGANLWVSPELYIENSPVFHLPKVQTPLLIMHNDNDGAVPYYQGIEMFMGMRRLQKPCWLLVYNKEQHNLRKMPNRLDLSARMFQFFNHYLKDEPMPNWMKVGVPAVDKGKDYGLEIE